ncbi:hypothetical protein Xaut_0987 [Xanthobacter versatilis]|uniref:MotA/TolQ/ExbB proton channel domain-containing protein n=1 Tax=Xanthobacter autotrophicus (strain ATCC BAA-1158 / Py2) TaxID=78245 RepID=A7IDZ5_XANP2|nr:hypothetical protein Xaut_0987 [Xanthobacter autotrophicus Py2]
MTVLKGLGRCVLFWTIIFGIFGVLYWLLPVVDMSALWGGTARAFSGDFSTVGTQPYAFALAFALFATAVGFASAFLILHVGPIGWRLRRLRLRIAGTGDMEGFARTYDATRALMERDRLISHAWKQFDTVLVHRPDERIIRSTARAHAFFNLGMAREKYFGLKMMGALPGYFVGIGLLLTFAGLVLALNKAAMAVNSSDAAGMQGATRELLQVATFKFATSIAGLGASIALSLLFRIYTILMEGFFIGFCETVEDRVRYLSAQQIAAESRDFAAEQTDQLKSINSADFFARMGQELTPGMSRMFETALDKVMSPVTTSIDQAVHRLADSSQSGMSEMLTRFTDSVQNGAGAELRGLAETLRGMQGAMVGVQQGLTGSGEDFGRRMSDAAENLNRLVTDAGARLGEGTDQSRAVLMDAVTAMRETFEQANRKVDEGLGAAAGGASARLEEVMGRVLGSLEAQVGGFRESLSGFQEKMAGQLDETRVRVSAAQAEATDAVAQASAQAARALQDGLADALVRINGEIERFVVAMRASEVTLAAQAKAMMDATDKSRQVADAFSRTAQDVRAASVPLAQSGERIAGATEKLGEAAGRSVAVLDKSQEEARRLAQALTGHVSNLDQVWRSYSARFEAVDEALGKAFERLTRGTDEQQDRIATFVRDVDVTFKEAVDTLAGCIGGLKDNTEEMVEAVDDLKRALRVEAAE